MTFYTSTLALAFEPVHVPDLRGRVPHGANRPRDLLLYDVDGPQGLTFPYLTLSHLTFPYLTLRYLTLPQGLLGSRVTYAPCVRSGKPSGSNPPLGSAGSKRFACVQLITRPPPCSDAGSCKFSHALERSAGKGLCWRELHRALSSGGNGTKRARPHAYHADRSIQGKREVMFQTCAHPVRSSRSCILGWL